MVREDVDHSLSKVSHTFRLFIHVFEVGEFVPNMLLVQKLEFSLVKLNPRLSNFLDFKQGFHFTHFHHLRPQEVCQVTR